MKTRPPLARDSLAFLAAVFAVIGVACIIGILISGCSKQPSTFTPAPQPVGTFAGPETFAAAAAWVGGRADRFFASVSATHSMEPIINEHSLVLCQRYAGQALPNGSVIVIDEGTGREHVAHVLADQNADSVYVSGSANHDSDGWYPKTKIQGFVVGQFYLPR